MRERKVRGRLHCELLRCVLFLSPRLWGSSQGFVLQGAIREKFDELRQRIISALAKVEALIDFGEGEEIEEGVYEDGLWSIFLVVLSVSPIDIKGYLNDHRRGELLRSGIRLAIFGPPNAGKSSLLNILGSFCPLSNHAPY
jgi:tRNA U34 5-carboxymethylaminomethyl modifying GTPase MnmE/TrmE